MIRVTDQNINTPEQWDKHYGTEQGLRTTGWNCHSAITVLTAVIPRNARVIDIACGSAYAPYNVSQRRKDIEWHGADFSDVIIKRHKAHAMLNWAGLHVMDITKPLSFRDKAFDVAMALEVLEHLNEPRRVIPEIARIASKQIILSVPNENRIATAYHVWSIGEQDIREWLEPYGRVETYVVRHYTKIIAVCDKRE